MHLAGDPVDDDGVAIVDQRHGIGGAADHGNTEGAGHDGHMAGRSALFQNQPADVLAVVVEQLGGAHVARHDDGVLGQFLAARAVRLVHQHAQEPVGQVVEIVQAFAQERRRLAQHARAHVALHLFHRAFRRQAVADRLLHAPHPAAVVGEHAIGFENVAMLAGGRDIVARQHVVDEQAQAGDRLVEPARFHRGVLADQRGHHHARLVQHGQPEADAFAQRQAADRDRTLQFERRARPAEARQLAHHDHLGQHHGRGLQRLDFFLVIGAMGRVLDDQNAERAAGPEHRHAEERVVDLFARFRDVAEGRVALGVGQIERPGFLGDAADQALADAQRGVVDGLGLQTLGGVELQHPVGVQDIDRAHLGHHVGRDLRHDLVEPGLRADRLRHDLAEATKQHARPGGGSAPHHRYPWAFSATSWGPPAVTCRARERRSVIVEPV